ncbi:MAG: hypothetical protein NWE96_11130 [Candidatus Bathyarchaeota archaeon]|nr:hypothetical protein [Candidatus Bathyarchaeota archaeon]
MKRTHILSVVLVVIIFAASGSLLISYTQSSNQTALSVYAGVAFGGTTVEQAKLLIDRTKTYTNLFILDCGINPISANESAVKEICDYATNAGLHIIVNLGTRTPNNWEWQLRFLNDSKVVYGDKYLGAYYDDEPIGIPFDWNWTEYWQNDFSKTNSTYTRSSLLPIYNKLQEATQTGIQPQSYAEEAQWYNALVSRNRGLLSLKQNNITTYTSDYLLYWYNYQAGYNTMFTQVGWNLSLTQQIAEIRGAATLQDKEWGAIITWKYNEPPYLDSGTNIYNQMVTAYNGGAKYITIFNYPYNNTENPYGTLTDEHFRALERFWKQIATKDPPTQAEAEAVLVLPKDYGFGMRRVDDKIWGFWGPDDKSALIWNNTQTLLARYGLGLDIVYDHPQYPLTKGNYSKVYFWNQTIN